MSHISPHISFIISSGAPYFFLFIYYIFLLSIISFLPEKFLLILLIVKIHCRLILFAFIYPKMSSLYPHVWRLFFDGCQILYWQVFCFNSYHSTHFWPPFFLMWHQLLFILLSLCMYFSFSAFKFSLYLFFGRSIVMKLGVDIFVLFSSLSSLSFMDL